MHKTANILDKMPKSVQKYAKEIIHEIYMAPRKTDGLKAFEKFLGKYEWQHIRTTNPIESTFATIRHRTRQTKGCGSRTVTLAMVYKLSMEAQKRWRKLRGHELINKLILGVQFKDGEEVFNMKYTA